jgi:hypothetical protein
VLQTKVSSHVLKFVHVVLHDIKSLSMPNDSSTEKMKTSDTISSLETKLRNMKDENKSLEQPLHTVKANYLVGSLSVY